jgi:hypothetical protein
MVQGITLLRMDRNGWFKLATIGERLFIMAECEAFGLFYICIRGGL